jgi:ribonuclease HII
MEDRFRLEQQLLQDHDLVIGVDEAGRGSLAGPVIAAAVSFSKPTQEPWWEEINDSKKLTETKREELAEKIKSFGQIGVGVASIEQISGLNVLGATMVAMRKAVADLVRRQNQQIYVLVDGNQRITGVKAKQFPMIKGDSRAHSIAAASIIAKVTRDNMMIEYHADYPEYDFAQHKGYGTMKHREAIQRHGLSPIHRPSFCQKILKVS